MSKGERKEKRKGQRELPGDNKKQAKKSNIESQRSDCFKLYHRSSGEHQIQTHNLTAMSWSFYTHAETEGRALRLGKARGESWNLRTKPEPSSMNGRNRTHWPRKASMKRVSSLDGKRGASKVLLSLLHTEM